MEGLANISAPGVYFAPDTRVSEPAFRTGVPVFIGRASSGAMNAPHWISHPGQLAAVLGPTPTGHLQTAVTGFFKNGGKR